MRCDHSGRSVVQTHTTVSRRIARCLWPTLACASLVGAAGFEGDTVVFGGDAAYPPFEWTERGTARGFNIELEDEIAAAGRVMPEHRLGDWPDMMRALESGDVDVVPMFRSAEREASLIFTTPYQFVHHGVFARPDTPLVSSLDDMSGTRIVVEEESFAHQQLRQSDIPAELVLTGNTRTALHAVADNRADYTILAIPTANYLIRSERLDLHLAGPLMWPREYAFAVRKDRPLLAAWLEQQFDTVLESGAYQQVYGRWDDHFLPAGKNRLQRILEIALLPLGILMLAGLWWTWSLRRAVAARSRRIVEEVSRRQAAESKLRWATDHHTETDMPRPHRFAEQAERLLRNAADGDRLQVVALRPADPGKTARAVSYEAGLAAVRDFADRLRKADFPVYGQIGRDVFLVCGAKDKLEREFRAVVAAGDTTKIYGSPYPRFFAGAATWPKHGRELPDLLRRAETALAHAVEHRRSWVEYRPSIEPAEADLQLVASFRETNGAGLYPEFQPQIDIATRKIVGAEALARWNAPGAGQVSPGRFIPLLEDAGLVRHVTRRMVRAAVRVSSELLQQGYPCPISVNMTVGDLLGWKLSRLIFKAVREYGGRASDLILELTETSVVDRPDVLNWVMRRLVKNGITISVDDFGTGFSSLAYLSQFPVQEIKIDQVFVRQMLHSRKDMSIVSSTIRLGHDLGLTVIAEGVESEQEMDALVRLGCDRAQGFLISKPLPEADFVGFVKNRPAAAAAGRLRRPAFRE